MLVGRECGESVVTSSAHDAWLVIWKGKGGPISVSVAERWMGKNVVSCGILFVVITRVGFGGMRSIRSSGGLRCRHPCCQ